MTFIRSGRKKSIEHDVGKTYFSFYYETLVILYKRNLTILS